MTCFDNPRYKSADKKTRFFVVPFDNKWAIQNSNKALLRSRAKIADQTIRGGGLIFTRYDLGGVVTFETKSEAYLFKENIRLDYARCPKFFRKLYEREWWQ